MVDGPNPPERPRVEPEIIPPDRAGRPSDGRRPAGQPVWGPYGSGQARGGQRIYVTRIGPLGFALLMLVVALLAAVFFIAILGAVLIWIPAVALLLAVAAVYRFLRR